MKNLFVIILLHSIVATPQINLYFTDEVSDAAVQHDCLRVAASVDQSKKNREIISYCITESLSKYTVENNDLFPRFTFAELSKQNITNQQLYHWSAPIDLIEHYQFYLNQLSTFNDTSLGTTIFYNCTLPRFGPVCQYEFDYYHPDHSSLYHIIHDFYRSFIYNPTKFTCYIHLQCDRGPHPLCLDWSEICDGKIDCHNGALDEEHCWQLEIHECQENEYRCANGQCIPQSFYLDDENTPDCLDQSDEHRQRLYLNERCNGAEPSFKCADIICTDMPLTSSCLKPRTQLLIDALFSVKDDLISDVCWSTFRCVLQMPNSMDSVCTDLCESKTYIAVINETCPELLVIPAVPVLFNDIYFAYMNIDAEYLDCGKFLSPYKCPITSRYDEFFVNSSKVTWNNRTCYRSVDSISHFGLIDAPWINAYAIPTYIELRKYTVLWKYTSVICNRSNMYQCVRSSKCISIYRLMDGITDCPYDDDEDFTKIDDIYVIGQMKRNYFECHESKKYISPSSIEDGKCDCGYTEDRWCDDENLEMNYVRRNISFPTICDGYIELLPILIDGRNQTDETECEQWMCNNIYTHCDGLWNCPNGADEIGCYTWSSLNCSIDEHLCVSNHTYQLVCLPVDRANDGHIDCVGATDEPNLCYKKNTIYHNNNFYCTTDRSISCLNVYSLCDIKTDCVHEEDERFCNKNRSALRIGSVCQLSYSPDRLEVEQFLCEISQDKRKKQIVHFSLGKSENLLEDATNNIEDTEFSFASLIGKPKEQDLYCHHGLDLRMWLDNHKNSSRTVCLCPPSFYGDQCEYQNQRISLSIRFRTSSHSRQTLFAIVITLAADDNERIIHSYEQFTYLSIRDCEIKFNVYLVYSSRAKNRSKDYAVHIDIYEKISLSYRGSVLIPIKFPFLPVHRLAFIVDIPQNNDSSGSCSGNSCIHGQCIRYSNNPQNSTFCQCHRGWSGRSCTIPYTCLCSSDSLCIGVTANNQSVCVCPLRRFGSHCLLTNTGCSVDEKSTCQNGGQCMPNDEYIESNQKFTCICPKGYIGKRCEIVENKITLSFERDISLPQSIFIHFIEIINDDRPRRATTFRTIPFKQDSIIIHWSQSFHLVFVQFPNSSYFLAVVQQNYNPPTTTTITKTIKPSDRCRHINELFNQTIVQLHLLRRIKYYQLPCERFSPNLTCFYDDIHLCLCQNHGRQHVANCFEFDHNKTFDCLGQSVCENGGQCFQDAPSCPQRTMCVCPPCFYGTRCQFTTSGFSLSLDGILGYHIQPHLKITEQPSIVQLSVALTIVFIIIGFINGILAILTFKNKRVHIVGCGYYLYGASISTLLTTVILGLKFWILLLAQMDVIMNRSFLSFQCHSLDFVLRGSLNMNQWLHACVAIERATTIIKGARFDKKKSKRIAKFVIVILLLLILGTGLSDPIHRRLIDEENEDEKRIWCVVSYSSGLQTFHSTMHILHYIIPFLFNLLSAIILIIKKSRQTAHIQTDRNYNQVFREEIRQYKHLLIAPVVLVILAIPHLIFSFASKCMKSTDSSWLLLAGYLISFIPPMLTFVVFILPSKFYKTELRTTITRYRTNVRRRLYAISSGSI